jgi:acetylxylan esterase
MKIIFITGALLSLVAASAAQAAAAQDTSCSRVHILVGRGSEEAKGMGATGRLVNQMKSAISGVTAEAIDYPAKISNYSPSSSAGTNAVVKQTTAYAKRCPNAKIVLMGYSQVMRGCQLE